MNLPSTFDQLLARVLRHAGSERRAAAAFGISPASFNAWCRGRALPDDDQCGKIAELLKIDPAYILALVHLERAHNKECERDVTDAWRRIVSAFGKAATLAILSAAPFMLPPPANASNAPVLHNGEQSTHWRRKRVFGVAL